MSKRDYDEYKDLFESIKQDPNNYVKELIKAISKALLERDRFVKNSDNIDERAKFFHTLQHKIEETYQEYLKRSNESSDDITKNIEFIGAGHTSLAFRIGDVVLKVGKEDNDWTSKLMEKYKNLPGIVPILHNSSFKVDDREYYSIQISSLVDTTQMDEEEVYGAYKKLRDEGYIWNDPLSENMGRMMNDFDDGDYHYKKGDIVIIDLEDLAYVGKGPVPDDVLDEISIMSYNRNTYAFETRYMDEKGNAK